MSDLCALGSAHRPEPVSATTRSHTTKTVESIDYGGYQIDAPGFTAETFAAALDRALADGLTMAPGRAPGTWLVRNESGGHRREYVVHPRYGCSCKSTQPCKHRALVATVEAILRPPARPP